MHNRLKLLIYHQLKLIKGMEFTVLCYSRRFLLLDLRRRRKLGEIIKKYCLFAKQPKQLIRVMKLTTVILLSTCLHVAAAGRAQKVTLSLEKCSYSKGI